MLDEGIFKDVVDATSNGVLITDPRQHDNPIIYVNHCFMRITGYD